MTFESSIHNVEVWCCDPRRCSVPAVFQEILSPKELAILKSFRLESPRQQYLVSHVMLRQLLSSYRPEFRPDDWRFCKNSFGKPFISNAIRAPLYFNITHSSEVVVVAISKLGGIGVDVETSSRSPDPQDVIDLCFSHTEKQHYYSMPVKTRQQAFLQRWTLKEAWLKALGVGLSVSPERIECVWQAGRWQIYDYHHQQNSTNGWSIYQQSLFEDGQLAVVASHPGALIQLKNWPGFIE